MIIIKSIKILKYYQMTTIKSKLHSMVTALLSNIKVSAKFLFSSITLYVGSNLWYTRKLLLIAAIFVSSVFKRKNYSLVLITEFYDFQLCLNLFLINKIYIEMIFIKINDNNEWFNITEFFQIFRSKNYLC